MKKIVFTLIMVAVLIQTATAQNQGDVNKDLYGKFNSAGKAIVKVNEKAENALKKAEEAIKNRPATSVPASPTQVTNVTKIIRDSQAQQTANRALSWSIRQSFVTTTGTYPDIESVEKLLSKIVTNKMSPKAFEDAVMATAKIEGWTYLECPLKSKDGAPGKDATPGRDGRDGKDGSAGKDADPTDVAEVLKTDPAFIAEVTGPPGADADKAEVDELKTKVDNLGQEIATKANKAEVARLSLVIADLNPDYAEDNHLLWSPVTGGGMEYQLNFDETILRDWLSDRFRKKDGTFEKKGAAKWLRSVLPDDLATAIANQL